MERFKLRSCQLTTLIILLYLLWGCVSLAPDYSASVSTDQPSDQVEAEADSSALAPGYSASVSTEQPSDQVEAEADNSAADLEPLTGTAPEENAAVEGLSAPEPEQTIGEEVRELEALGAWEEGKSEQTAAKPEAETEEEIQYDFPITMNRQVEFYLDFFQNKQQKTFARWLARSGRYVPMIREKLKEAGLPQDLAYLPMIESGFSLTAYSRARAVGPWQFIRATGRRYGLKINNTIDERRDPVKSTEAAIAYLSDLYEEFGCWELAVAGYNAGEGKIKRAVAKYKTENFWEISKKRFLKAETKLYVPKLIAAIMIAKDPETYGFSDIDYEDPLQYETVEVPPWTSLKAVALACDTEYEIIQNLNRHLRKGFTPSTSSRYPVKVPVGSKSLVTENLHRVRPIVKTAYKNHVVKRGETITRICRRYNLNKTILLKANNLRSPNLTPGQRLRIPFQTTTYKLVAKNSAFGKSGAADASPDNLVLHTVKPGETVSQLAKRYNVPPYLIATWNGLKDIQHIKAGQQLAFYLQDNTGLAHINPEEQHTVAALSNPTAKKQRPADSLSDAHYADDSEAEEPSTSTITYYQVQGGDTLWDIARKFQVTPQNIKRWNSLKNDIIHPGNRLLLKVASDIDA